MIKVDINIVYLGANIINIYHGFIAIMINSMGTEVKEVFKVKKENGNIDRQSRLMPELITAIQNAIVGNNGDRHYENYQE